MEWKIDLIEALKPYGEPVETPEGVLFELVDEESGVYDRLAFYVEDPLKEDALAEVLIEAIKDLTDHDLPGRNVFAFGFRPDFSGEVIGLSFFEARPGKGAVVGEVPPKVVETAERNGLSFQRCEGNGIGLPKDYSGGDFEELVKLVEAVAFEW
ncbi:hypothetical protein [Thermococcus sp.]